MTTVYFVRHAESDDRVRNDRMRPLTQKGLEDRALVTRYLQDKGISAVVSSPYKRAADTVGPLAEKLGLEVTVDEEFRERKSDSQWLSDSDFWLHVRRQWADFTYKLSDGESLAEVQARGLAALHRVLERHQGGALVIGTHGTALAALLRHYEAGFGYDDFMAMVRIKPWVVKMEFDGQKCIEIQKLDLFKAGR